MHKSVTIVANENKVTAYCDGKKGVARCHPDDAFDFYAGAKLALERLKKAENPYAWLEEGVTYYYPLPVVGTLYNSATYRADNWDKRVIERGIVFKTKEEAIECAKKMLAAVKQEG
jgi:hypothetical protein